MNKIQRQNGMSQEFNFVIDESDARSEEDDEIKKSSSGNIHLQEKATFVKLKIQNPLQQSKSQIKVKKQIVNKYLLQQSILKEKSLPIFKNNLKQKALQISHKFYSYNQFQDINHQIRRDQRRVGEVFQNETKESKAISKQFSLNLYKQQKVKLIKKELKQQNQIKVSDQNKFNALNPSEQQRKIEQTNKNWQKNQLDIESKNREHNLCRLVVYTCIGICIIAIFQVLLKVCSKGF